MTLYSIRDRVCLKTQACRCSTDTADVFQVVQILGKLPAQQYRIRSETRGREVIAFEYEIRPVIPDAIAQARRALRQST